MIKFLDLSKQYFSIKKEVDHAVSSVLNEASFIGGPHLKSFEENFARYVGAQNCVGVGNGTDALEIAIEALDLPKNSEILVPANSFIASSEAVTRTGHKVVFVDACPNSYVISLEDVKKKITSKTSAIIAVHLYGHPCDMDGLVDIARGADLKIIEDCAQAHGAKFKGKTVGSLGDIATFSFYPGKNLGAYGDGGAITSNDKALAESCRMIANHGRIAKYEHQFEGRNSRLDALQASILNVKLNHIENWTAKRVEIADYYIANLSNHPEICLPIRQPWADHVYHLFVIRVSDREALKKFLYDNGVETGVHYPTALPKLKAYELHRQRNEKMLCSIHDSTLLSLPIGDHLSERDVDYVCKQIQKFYH